MLLTVLNNFLIFNLMVLQTSFPKLVIKNPNGRSIHFTVVDFSEREKIMKTEAVRLYKVDRILIFNNEIHELKNGDYLFLYTAHDYAFRFSSKEELDLFTNNENHFTCSIHIDTKKLTYTYGFRLHNEKAIEMMKEIDTEVDGYPPKNADFRHKLFRLKDGSFLRAEERMAKNGYEAEWFPNLETFVFLYENAFTS